LTVVGFSVNDTVVIFDRIRENQVKLKDKKLERIVDISLNEVAGAVDPDLARRCSR
jgi:preprotein translocase subunit SecF